MYTIQFDKIETYDDINGFGILEGKTANFEYSLLAVSKWEAKWGVPYLSTEFKADDKRLLDLYKYMSDTDLDDEYFTKPVMIELSEYINSSQTATRFYSQNGNKNQKSGKVYTAEEIYALMFMNHIPIAFENRNLNNLLIILKIISLYSEPPEKMSKHEVLRQNANLNEQRRKMYNTRG